MAQPQSSIIAKECRHAIHIPSKSPDQPDFHLVKEQVHRSDGTVTPAIRFIRDFQRKFWITRKTYQNHQEKKEWETLDKLLEYTCTQSKLRDTLAHALGMGYSRDSLKKLMGSPYVYGADVSSTSLIKKAYADQYPEVITPYTVATFDIETNVFKPNFEIIVATVVFKNEVVTAVLKSFVEGYAGVPQRVEAAMAQYLGEYLEKRGLHCQFFLCETEIEVLQTCFTHIHRWKPDFLTIWNKDFDIPKTVAACERAGVDPKDLFSDPTVPEALRFFKYKQGKKKKVTASGKEMPIPPASQWHITECPASFTVVDSMCVYKRLRMAEPEEPSYSLDAILKKELQIQKLKFKAAEGYVDLAWHRFMQAHHPIEYIIYNRFDNISMLELDEKTQDLSYKLPSFAKFTDFNNFHLSTRKIMDDMYFFCESRGRVLSAHGSSDRPLNSKTPMTDWDEEAIEDPEEKTLGLEDWIVTLPAHNVTLSGLRCIEEDPLIATNARGFVSDSDAVSSYPSDISALNVSKETTRRELIGIEGIEEEVFRAQNINLLSGPSNAVEYTTMMFGAPTLPELLKLFQAELVYNPHSEKDTV
jgi:hypothetical protein